MNALFEKFASMKIGDRFFLTGEGFDRLIEADYINKKKLRDFDIQQKYRELKKNMRQDAAIDEIRKVYPYLQFDTIRKIVYAVS